LRDVAYEQIPRAARAGKHVRAAGWIESLSRPQDHAEMVAHHYLNAMDLARAASQDTADLAPQARAVLQAAGDRAFTLGAVATSAGFYRAALALWPQDAQTQRAGLLRRLGTMQFEAGELERAEATLAKGAEAAASAGLAAMEARIRILLAEIRNQRGGPMAAALAACDTAIAVLDSEGDLEGLAEAWLLAGRLRFFRGEWPADKEGLERAARYAQQSSNHRAHALATSWLGFTFAELPGPADAAIARVEQLLQTATGEPWAQAHLLMSLSLLYAYAGRFADARAACARGRSILADSAARLQLAETALPAAEMELIVGDLAAAERYLKEGHDALRAMGERGYRSSFAGRLAEVLYMQGRRDEAYQMTEEAQTAAAHDDIDARAQWRAARAKLLAQRGEVPAARQIVDEAEALVSPTSWAVVKARMLMAKAEVNKLAGAPEQAAASLRAAAGIYRDHHVAPLADRVEAALASLTEHPSIKPA
jgi:tetratricopeptide (TPR) repeat protein